MFDRLTTLPHGLRVFVEALLYGLQYILMLPARDAPLHAGGAALLERTVATRICPIASQLLPVLLVRIVVLQLFASRTAIRILVAEIDKVLHQSRPARGSERTSGRSACNLSNCAARWAYSRQRALRSMGVSSKPSTPATRTSRAGK